MRKITLDRIVGVCRAESAFHVVTTILLVFLASLLLDSMRLAFAQDEKAGPPPSAPSPGKALIYIYRVGRFTGSAAHDHLYVNGVYLAYLKNGEYAGTEVNPGNVVVTGLPEMYTVDIFTAAGAAVNDATRKENERIRFTAEPGKAYYLKWTSGTMATGIKVTTMDPVVGAKEMSKLHLSKPVEQPINKKPEDSK